MGLRDVGRTTLRIEQMRMMRNRVLADNNRLSLSQSGHPTSLVPQITVISPPGAILRYFHAILPSFPSMLQDV